MSHVYENAALRILDWLRHAERDLIGKTVVTFKGQTGTVSDVKLDSHHGLVFSIDMRAKHVGTPPGRHWYPVSTIKEKSR